MANSMRFHLNEKPVLVRFLLAALLSYLTVFAAISFYQFTSSVTDENIFVDTPGRVVITRPLAARLVVDEEKKNHSTAATQPDTVQPGSLVFIADEVKSPSIDQVMGKLKKGASGQSIALEILRPGGQKPRLYLFSSNDSIPTDALKPLKNSVMVTQVEPGGASDRAGMQVGDLIFKINNQEFKNSRHADEILRSNQAGKAIDYEILRGTELMTLKVTMARFGIQLATLIFFLAGLVYFAMGGFIGLSRPQIAAARLLALSMILMGSFIMANSTLRGTPVSFFARIRNVNMILSLIWGITFFFRSTWYFPLEVPEVLSKRWITAVGYGMALVVSLFNLWTPQKLFTGPSFIGTLLATHIVLMLLNRRHQSAEYRRITQPIKWAGALATISIMVIALIVVRHAPGLGNRYGYIGLPLILIPLAYLYVIARYRLLEMDFRLRRNVQYNLAVSFWLALVVFAWLVLISGLMTARFKLPQFEISRHSIQVIDAPVSAEENLTAEKGLVILFALASSVFFQRLYRRGKKFLNQKFYRSEYDYRHANSQLAEVLTTRQTPAELAGHLAAHLQEWMRLKKVAVLFYGDGGEIQVTGAAGLPDLVWEEKSRPIANGLLPLCRVNPRPVRFQSEYLPREIKTSLQELGLAFIFPLLSDNQVLGAVLLGEKLSETPFYPEDIDVATMLVRQAAMALENIRLYHQVSQQERLRHELEIARRIQLSSLPQKTPVIAELAIAAASLPAQEVGGDYYEYLNGRDRELTVVVGDVSGKGISAALYMSRVQGILRSLHAFAASPRELFIRTNQVLSEGLEKQYFVTALGARFDVRRRQLTVTRAGHLPLFHYCAGENRVECITPRGMGFGLDTTDAFAEELQELQVPYGSRDVFLFVTDGVTDARAPSGDMFGEEQLAQLFLHSASGSAADICRAITEAVHRFAKDVPPFDDQTIVVVSIN